MRRRLTVAFSLFAVGVLLVSGIVGVVLTDRAARAQATSQLTAQTESLAKGSHGVRLGQLAVVRRVLRLEDARIIRVDAFGQVVTSLPAGLTAGDLQGPSLLEGNTVSGWDRGLAFAAAPITVAPGAEARLGAGGQLAIVLTRQVGAVGPSALYFVVAGAIALAVAAIVASQMSRRMVRPLAEAVDTTRRITSGDLASRVPARAGDYSEFASLARSINTMAQRLESSRNRERHLLLAVSHDLRTPLTSIRGFAEAIADGVTADNAQAARVIIAESRRLERLVGDLLDLTKLEAKQLSISNRSVDLTEVVENTTNGFRPVADRLAVTLSIVLAGNESGSRMPSVPVQTDPDRLAQMLANLVENAISYARSSVTVTLQGPVSGHDGRCHRISVDDDGPGIAAADLPRVFERFYRGDRARNRLGGSGLGLAIVGELAAALGATALVESPTLDGVGSRFVLELAAPNDVGPTGPATASGDPRHAPPQPRECPPEGGGLSRRRLPAIE